MGEQSALRTVMVLCSYRDVDIRRVFIMMVDNQMHGVERE